MCVEVDSMPDIMLYKPGTLDNQNVLNEVPVIREIYTRNRPNCFNALNGAEQKKAA